jgi:hypothetical protein
MYERATETLANGRLSGVAAYEGRYYAYHTCGKLRRVLRRSGDLRQLALAKNRSIGWPKDP